MAVKIVRQEKNIALLGVPTSAAALAAGRERAPATLRAAGLLPRLTEAGFTVIDHGDCTMRVFEVDEEHPRARNVKQVLATLEELRPKVEVAVKSGGLPVILGGDSSIVLAVVAGVRRYFRNVSLVFLDRNADLKEPATTQTGSMDDMVISHVLGRGAPELVRFWGEPPLVRAPDVVLFGIDRPDEAELQFMMRSPLRRYLAEDVTRVGGAAAAEDALGQAHARLNDFVLHLDLNVIAPEDFSAANPSRSGGLALDQVRQALAIFARQATLAALVISSYNPALDPDGSAAKQLIDLVVGTLSPRLKKSVTAEIREATASSPLAPSLPDDSDAASAPEAESSSSAKVSVDNPPVGIEVGESRSVESPVPAAPSRVDSSVESPSSDREQNAPIEQVPGKVSESGSTSSAVLPDPISPDASVERETPDR